MVEEAFERLVGLSGVANADGDGVLALEAGGGDDGFGEQGDDSTKVAGESTEKPEPENPKEIGAAAKVMSADAAVSVERARDALHEPTSARIDKSVLALPEPKRHRNKEHLRFVATHACLVCGRKPSDPHHLRFTQPRALGRKVSDEFAVPLCRAHHRAVHRVGDERAWWNASGIDPVKVARRLWKETRLGGGKDQQQVALLAGRPQPPIVAAKSVGANGTGSDPDVARSESNGRAP